MGPLSVQFSTHCHYLVFSSGQGSHVSMCLPLCTHCPLFPSSPVSVFLGNKYFVFLSIRVLDCYVAGGLDGQAGGQEAPGCNGHRLPRGGGGHVGDDGHRGPDVCHRGVGQAEGGQAAQRVEVVNQVRSVEVLHVNVAESVVTQSGENVSGPGVSTTDCLETGNTGRQD